ncbi:MAG: hypothetical protein ACPGVB_02175 [Chitinophagales bacterium]
MKVIKKVQKENSVIPLTKATQISLRGGRVQQKFVSDKEGSHSSPPRWKDE